MDDHVEQLSARHELHHEVDRLLLVEDLKEADDIRVVADGLHDLNLARDVVHVLDLRLVDHLDRDRVRNGLAQLLRRAGLRECRLEDLREIALAELVLLRVVIVRLLQLALASSKERHRGCCRRARCEPLSA